MSRLLFDPVQMHLLRELSDLSRADVTVGPLRERPCVHPDGIVDTVIEVVAEIYGVPMRLAGHGEDRYAAAEDLLRHVEED